jgi:hypothetical protein
MPTTLPEAIRITLGFAAVESVSWDSTAGLRIGGVAQETGVESLISAQLHIVATGPGTYEKAAIMAFTTTSDANSPGDMKDAVGLDARAQISDGNLQGRAWGAYFEGLVRPGGDGIVQAAEFALFQHGSDQPDVGTLTSKSGASFTLYGGHGTSCINILGNGGSELGQPAPRTVWHKGIYSHEDHIGGGPGDHFIELDGVDCTRFGIDRRGNVTIAGNVAHTPVLGSELIAGNNNNYDFGDAGFVRVGMPGPSRLTGLKAGRDGQIVAILLDGPGTLTIANDSPLSLPANRILTLAGGDLVRIPGSRFEHFRYVEAHQRWVLE